jgi:hypothetical protein
LGVRQFIVYSFIAFYFLISIGFKGNLHFCCGELKSFSLIGYSEQKSCCKAPTSENLSFTKKKCCENVRLSFEKTGSEQRVILPQIPQQQPIIAPDAFFPLVFYHVTETREPRIFHHPPPPDLSQPLYIRNCVFRI